MTLTTVVCACVVFAAFAVLFYVMRLELVSLYDNAKASADRARELAHSAARSAAECTTAVHACHNSLAKAQELLAHAETSARNARGRVRSDANRKPVKVVIRTDDKPKRRARGELMRVVVDTVNANPDGVMGREVATRASLPIALTTNCLERAAKMQRVRKEQITRPDGRRRNVWFPA